jgi:uncharacterized protein
MRREVVHMTVKMMFANLAVKDLKQSMEFFSKLGFEFNPQFTNDLAASMVIGDNMFAMLLTHDHFKNFTKKEIADATSTTESIIALAVNSREEVNTYVEKAIEAGGKEPMKAQDHGFMYQRSIEDLDGHIWEFFYMDESTIK